MSKLRIYKASAGAGKTFRLAVEYLKIALAAEWNYRNILAVTFTNKATAEMKERVISELYKLGGGEHTAYLAILMEETGLSGAELALRARRCLKNILHDYSRFSISTIDSFFQRVIKAFGRELGIYTSYRVDLDYDQALEEATDELLLSLDENSQLQEWLKEFAREKIQEGLNWNLKGDIIELGRQIDNETFKELSPVLHKKLNDKNFISGYRRELEKIIKLFENTLKEMGRDGLRIIEDRGFTVNDFKYGKSGPANTFNHLLKAELPMGIRLLRTIDDITELYKIPDKKGLESTAEKIHPLLCKAVAYYRENLNYYNTAKLIVARLYTLGILVDLQEMVRKVTREKNAVLISESGSLLKKIIAGAETPFIYERTGIRYNHFMIDEFQDTSVMQWNNFKPLIADSLSGGNLGMVVGDVKQAIYRWRNGDWTLLASKLYGAFPAHGFAETTLKNNWRSSGRVIRFNNRIFQVAPELLQQRFNGEFDEFTETNAEQADAESVHLSGTTLTSEIVNIFRESIQHPGKDTEGDNGYVRLRFLEKPLRGDNDDSPQADPVQLTLDDLVEQIKKIQKRGAAARDIAVLVRKKSEAALIADRLLGEKEVSKGTYNFNVLSSESLYVKNSPAVSFIISLLTLLVNPDDRLSLTTANFRYYSEIEPRLPDSGLQPALWPVPKDDLQEPTPHKEYHPTLAEQFESPDDTSNELHTFLKSPLFTEMAGSHNLQEAAFKICEIFRLFDIEDDRPYLIAFCDQIDAFIKDKNVDISSFLMWWEDKGSKKTINVPEELDAIRIQTIHKAKGLEYDYVLIPFCDWALDVHASMAPVLWCRPQEAPFNSLELVPVRYDPSVNNNKMANSLFAAEFFAEKINNYIDNLNLLYVAFTRAKTALFTWSVSGGELKTVGDLLHMCIRNNDKVPHHGYDHLTLNLTEWYDEADMLFESGTLAHVAADIDNTKDKRALRFAEISFSDFNDYLRLRQSYQDFFETEPHIDSHVNRGKIIHEVLAKIKTAGDLEAAVHEQVFSGVLTLAEAGLITQQIRAMLADEEVKYWFDGTYRILNERSVLTGKNGLKRPDRIMLKGEEAVVVDYKSGDKEPDSYKYQLRGYIRALNACGYKDVTGYIWYTRYNKRVRVAANE